MAILSFRWQLTGILPLLSHLCAQAPLRSATLIPRIAHAALLCTKPSNRLPKGLGNYVKASIQGLMAEGLLPEEARGFRAVVDGNIPDSAGLSSSAALVVVSALAALAVNDVAVQTVATGRSIGKGGAVCWHGGRGDGSGHFVARPRGQCPQDRFLSTAGRTGSVP